MEQEIQATILIFDSNTSNLFEHELEEHLQSKLTNSNTKIHVIQTYSNRYKIVVTGSIRATWKLKLGPKTASLINDNMLQGLGYEVWQITLLNIKEEAEIYGNK